MKEKGWKDRDGGKGLEGKGWKDRVAGIGME